MHKKSVKLIEDSRGVGEAQPKALTIDLATSSLRLSFLRTLGLPCPEKLQVAISSVLKNDILCSQEIEKRLQPDSSEEESRAAA
ncbi:hypothetical protein AFK49_004075 [Corynebacterium ulcerans]|nr:hypothetical protein AFK49_004075 [Corynebacterium ulcerans]